MAHHVDNPTLNAGKLYSQGRDPEASRAMIRWLRSQGVSSFAAFIHPEHHASMTLAKNPGFAPTNTIEDGEIRWELVNGALRNPR